MEADKHYTYRLIEGIPNSEELDALLVLYQNIFDDARIDFFKQRINEKDDLLSILVYKDEIPIGFKVGYNYNENTFYSWVGGILQSYRKQGLASKLAHLQENWAKHKQYTKLRTKSMNRFKPMIILNLKNNFDIIQVYTNESGQTKIIFEKDI